MATKGSETVFKSFEQLKSELFPRLTNEERKRSPKWGSKQIGACMADDAIDELLRERRKPNA